MKDLLVEIPNSQGLYINKADGELLLEDCEGNFEAITGVLEVIDDEEFI